MSTAILLANTGTPCAPTAKAVRTYLRQFLSDKRIVQLPRLLWLPILYGLILPLRPKKSAHMYQQIWTKQGSPMRTYMEALKTELSGEYRVEIGMNYGNPSIAQALEKLLASKPKQLVILPMFPQQSNTTTAATLDKVGAALARINELSDIRFIPRYCESDLYIAALANSVIQHRKTTSAPRHLLISFHGIPKRFVAKGDPYQKECEITAMALAKKLNLAPHEWTLCYQSQFGYDKWLQPSTQALFDNLPKQNIKAIDVICPGFSVDCLETLEEISMRGREAFLAAGGESFHYIPALNASQDHVSLVRSLLKT